MSYENWNPDFSRGRNHLLIVRAKALFGDFNWKGQVALLQQNAIRIASQEGSKILSLLFFTNLYKDVIGCSGMNEGNLFVVGSAKGFVPQQLATTADLIACRHSRATR